MLFNHIIQPGGPRHSGVNYVPETDQGAEGSQAQSLDCWTTEPHHRVLPLTARLGCLDLSLGTQVAGKGFKERCCDQGCFEQWSPWARSRSYRRGTVIFQMSATFRTPPYPYVARASVGLSENK